MYEIARIPAKKAVAREQTSMFRVELLGVEMSHAPSIQVVVWDDWIDSFGRSIHLPVSWQITLR